jgi:CheY-like chemotaxis protein
MSAASRTILIVEDNPDLRESLAQLCRGEGYAVALAEDGQKALRYLNDHDPPCVILLDLMLPYMDGWQFRKRQLDLPRLAAIPVVVLSAVSASYLRADELRALAYLPKPFDVQRLLDLIAGCCPAEPSP